MTTEATKLRQVWTKDEIEAIVDEAYEKYRDYKGGANASYIPFLAQVPSDLTGVAVALPDGSIISRGDSDYRFAIESISKVCTLILALKQKGSEAVRMKVGTSPTGLPFNSVMALELHGDRPLSPLVNAGAMATVSLLDAKDQEDRWQAILNIQRELMSDKVELSTEVNQSEQTTNFHNRAIAWLLYSAGNMYCDPMEACTVYTRQCSTLVSTNELALMAGVLANRGCHPKSGERILDSKLVPRVLAEMTMEGLYDGSGDWAYEVGLPAKSGVGGGLMAVAPGQMGIAAFSPPLDKAGNSVRAQKIIGYISRKLNLNR